MDKFSKEKDAIPMCVVLPDADNASTFVRNELCREMTSPTGKEDWNHIERRSAIGTSSRRGFCRHLLVRRTRWGSADEDRLSSRRGGRLKRFLR